MRLMYVVTIPYTTTARLLEKQADGTWSGLQPIQVEGLSEMEAAPDQSHFYFHLSFDEQHLFLSYHPKGGENEEDLFYAKKQGNGFAKPVALTSLNSLGYETAPFLSKDGRKLYFASNRDDLEGNNADIYVSERQGNDWTKWSAPQKMDGPYEALNSGKFDAYLVLHNEGDIENFGFFASNRDARMADIYAFDLIRRYNLEVLVVDGRTNEPLKTTIGQLTKSGNLQNPKTSDGQKFNYAFEGPGVLGEYRFVADATNYRDTIISFTIALEEYQKKVIVPLFREKKIEDITVPEFTVYYEFDRFDKIYTYPITPQDSLDLLAQGILASEKLALMNKFDSLKRALEANPAEKIYLRGHADFIGNTDKNIILSKNRINTVRKFLQSLGIPNDRIREDLVVALGEGESVQDADDVTRASNRKVEIFRAERSGRENPNP
ncbi:MAG: OmpA family protein [Microscillaceae bacterium]|nr:OmpA family protein [Microscillaceae bacterium]